MTEHTLKVGDVVRLASGGPPMTVEEVRVDGLLSCCWFVGLKTTREGFDPAMLVVASGPGTGFPQGHHTSGSFGFHV